MKRKLNEIFGWAAFLAIPFFFLLGPISLFLIGFISVLLAPFLILLVIVIGSYDQLKKRLKRPTNEQL